MQKPDDLQPIRHEIDPNLHRSRDRILPWRTRKNFDNFSILNIFEIVTKCNKYINKLENNVENCLKQLIQDVPSMN